MVTTLEGRVTLADAESLVESHLEILRRRESHASVFDTERVQGVPDAVVRKRLGEFVTESAKQSLESTVCVAIVIPSALLRGALTAVHWIGRPVVPVKTFPSIEGAVTWTTAELGVRGLKVPSNRALGS